MWSRYQKATALWIAGTLLVLLGGPLAVPLGKVVHRLPAVEYATQPAAPSAATHVNFTLNATDYPSYLPNRFTVTPGTNISFFVHNTGVYNHTFTLSRLPSSPGSPNPDPHFTPTQLYQFFNRYGSFVNISVAPSATVEANFSTSIALAGASLEFVSVVPFQFQAGMSGFLNVTAPRGPAVNLTENATSQLNFVPNTLVVNATKFPAAINVAVYDIGGVPHTWTLESQSNVTLFPGNFTTYFSQHPPLVSVQVGATAGVPYWGNFSVNTPGVYEYICTVAGHFAPPSGNMFGSLYVGVRPPVNTTSPPSTAIVEGGILVGGVALLGFGALLAAVASLSGRFPKTDERASYHP